VGKRAETRRLTRRRFLKAVAAAAVGGVAGAAVDALAVEPRWLRLTWPVIRVPGLPRQWDGLRLAHLTDMHRGGLVPLKYIARAVGLSNAARPDIVVCTGDFVTGRGAVTAELARTLKGLRARLGVFAVLGNHDHWAGAEAVRQMLAEASIALLDNRRVVLERRGASLVLAGVGDLWEDVQDLAAALDGVPAAAPRLLLCHNPDYADAMPPEPRVDLMFCGHTHGGQVKIPFGPRPMLPIRNRRYAAGLVRAPRCLMYVSRGIGMVGLAVRFNCRPELPIITLRRDAQ